jgi:uncharacterized membrane protein
MSLIEFAFNDRGKRIFGIILLILPYIYTLVISVITLVNPLAINNGRWLVEAAPIILANVVTIIGCIIAFYFSQFFRRNAKLVNLRWLPWLAMAAIIIPVYHYCPLNFPNTIKIIDNLATI